MWDVPSKVSWKAVASMLQDVTLSRLVISSDDFDCAEETSLVEKELLQGLRLNTSLEEVTISLSDTQLDTDSGFEWKSQAYCTRNRALKAFTSHSSTGSLPLASLPLVLAALKRGSSSSPELLSELSSTVLFSILRSRDEIWAHNESPMIAWACDDNAMSIL